MKGTSFFYNCCNIFLGDVFSWFIVLSDWRKSLLGSIAEFRFFFSVPAGVRILDTSLGHWISTRKEICSTKRKMCSQMIILNINNIMLRFYSVRNFDSEFLNLTLTNILIAQQSSSLFLVASVIWGERLIFGRVPSSTVSQRAQLPTHSVDLSLSLVCASYCRQRWWWL